MPALQSGGDIVPHCGLKCRILHTGASTCGLTGDQRHAQSRRVSAHRFLFQNLEPEVPGLHVVKQSRAGRLGAWHGGSSEAGGQGTHLCQQPTATKSKSQAGHYFSPHCPPHRALRPFHSSMLLTLEIHLRFYPASAL